MLTKFKKFILRAIIKKEVKQSTYHQQTIMDLYQLIEDTCWKEFTEDTLPIMQGFLLKCMNKQQAESIKRLEVSK